PRLGTVEIWRFTNRSGFMHPMHMHLVMFQVLDHQPFRLSGEDVVPQGDASPPRASELGLKDTIQVAPFEIVRGIARFEDYGGKFPYHCHILEHEDHEMMRQFETVSSCGDGVLAQNVEECDDGNTTSGDGCTAECRLEPDAGATDGGGLGRLDAS